MGVSLRTGVVTPVLPGPQAWGSGRRFALDGQTLPGGVTGLLGSVRTAQAGHTAPRGGESGARGPGCDGDGREKAGPED